MHTPEGDFPDPLDPPMKFGRKAKAWLARRIQNMLFEVVTSSPDDFVLVADGSGWKPQGRWYAHRLVSTAAIPSVCHLGGLWRMAGARIFERLVVFEHECGGR